MEIIKKLNRDTLFMVKLGIYDHSSEYLLVNANDSDDVYAVLEESETES